MTDPRNENGSVRSVSSDGDEYPDQPEGRKTRSSSDSTPPRLLVYTPDELSAIRQSPLSLRWPDFLDEAFKNDQGQWDPKRWHQDLKRGCTPPPGDEKSKTSMGDRPTLGLSIEGGKKRDPKERIKADQFDTGIVLSPQRKSFLTGCQGTSSNGGLNSQQSGAPGDGLSKKEEISLRPDTRRVGSGRILNRERENDPAGDRGSGRFDRRDDRFDNRGGFRRANDVPQRDDLRPRRGDQDIDPRQRRGELIENPRQRRGEPSDDPRQRRVEPNDDPRQRRGDPSDDPRQRRGDPIDDSRRNRNYGPNDNWYGRRDERDDYSQGSGRGNMDSRMQRRDDKPQRRRLGDSGHWRPDNDEPEWMSATVDQNELMELHGFEDSPEKEIASACSEQARQNRQQYKDLEYKFGRAEDQKEATHRRKEAPRESRQSEPNHHDPHMDRDPHMDQGHGFDIDDILKIDVIPGIVSMLDEENSATELHQAESSGGRFSQFFQRPLQQQQQSEQAYKNDDRRSSIQDGLCVNANLLRELNKDGHLQPSGLPNVRIPSPGDPSAYFAPVSPAAKTTNEPPASNSILNLFMANAPVDTSSEMLSAPSLSELRGKQVRSVEEVEADIKKLAGINHQSDDGHHNHQHVQQQLRMIRSHQQQQLQQQIQQEQQAKKEEMSAFEKFALMVGGTPEPVQKLILHFPNPMIPVGGLEAHQRNSGLVRPSPLPANAPTEQGILAGMIGPRPSGPPSSNIGARGPHLMGQPQPHTAASTNELLQRIYHAPFNMDALKQPEAQALQHALSTKHVSLEVLLDLFANGNMPGPQREILLSVLKLAQSSGQLGPVPPPGTQVRGLTGRGGSHSPLPPNTLDVFQQQQQRLSPIVGGLTVVSPTQNQRIPSPQELVIHTQQIMQNALIKRKLEEQKEKYRQRQGVPTSEAGPKVRSTDSPLVFTPTVVMKKIVADRRDSDPSVNKVQVPELKISQSNDKENGHIALHNTAQPPFSRSSPLPPVLNIIPPGSGMLPPPPSAVGGIRQQPIPSHLLALQQQHLRMQHAAMQQQFANMHQGGPPAMHQGGPPTGMMDPQRFFMMNPQASLMQVMGHMPNNFPTHQRPPLIPQPHPCQLPHPLQHSGQPQPPVSGLLRFFSQEVLAQAQAGNAPPLPPLPTQKALTLEEIERQSAAVKIQ